MKDINKIIGERIKALRLREDLTQEELAEKTNLHPSYVGILERGERNPSIKSLAKIAAVFSVDTHYFLDTGRRIRLPNPVSAHYLEISRMLENKSEDDITFALSLLKQILDKLESRSKKRRKPVQESQANSKRITKTGTQKSRKSGTSVFIA